MKPSKLRFHFVLGAIALLGGAAAAETTTGYQKPAKPILDVLHARLPPNAFMSPARDSMILATRERYPPISDLARYTAMESTEHVLWEMLGWFDRYVKQAPRRSKTAAQR